MPAGGARTKAGQRQVRRAVKRESLQAQARQYKSPGATAHRPMHKARPTHHPVATPENDRAELRQQVIEAFLGRRTVPKLSKITPPTRTETATEKAESKRIGYEQPGYPDHSRSDAKKQYEKRMKVLKKDFVKILLGEKPLPTHPVFHQRDWMPRIFPNSPPEVNKISPDGKRRYGSLGDFGRMFEENLAPDMRQKRRVRKI